MSVSLKARSVTFSAVMNVLLSASNMLFGLITLPIVSRVLSVDGYGSVTFAQSAGMWFSVLAMLGMQTYGIRECTKCRDDEKRLVAVVKELLTILAISTSIAALVFMACIFIVPKFQTQSFLMWVFLINMVLTSFGVEWFFQAIEQYAYITVRNVVFKAISLIAILLFVHNPEDYNIYGVILAFATSASNVINIMRMTRILPLSLHVRMDVKRHIRPMFYFAWTVIAANIYTVFDSVLLGLLSTNYQVGLYQLAGKLKAVATTAINAAGNATIPRLTYYYSKENRDKYDNLLEKDLRLVLTIGLSVVVLTLLFADNIILLFSTPRFLAADVPLRISSFVILFAALSGVLTNMVLIPTGRERLAATTGGVAVVFSLLLNILLDRAFGAIGASIALLVAEGTVALICILFCKEDLFRLNCKDVLGTTVGGAVLSGIITWIVSSMLQTLPSLVALIVGCCCYSLIYGSWLLLRRDQLIISILSKFKLFRQ